MLLVAAYSGLIPPDKWRLPLFFALAFPVFFYIESLLLLMHLFLRPRKMIWLPVLFLLLAYPACRNYFPLHGKRSDNGKPTLTILTYNVYLFRQAQNIDKDNSILRLLQECDADIVCLQEYGSFNDNQQSQIDHILSQYPYKHIVRAGKSSSGQACYSKYPIAESEPIQFRDTRNSAVRYTIDVEGKPLSLINCHLESNRLEKADKELYVQMATHPGQTNDLLPQAKEKLLRKIARATVARAEQARTIRRIVDSLPGAVVVCGDFNDTPQSYTYHKIRGKMHDAYISTGFGPGITYNAYGLWFRIDHILCNDSLRAVDSRIIHKKYSDHYPVMATLQWNAD